MFLSQNDLIFFYSALLRSIAALFTIYVANSAEMVDINTFSINMFPKFWLRCCPCTHPNTANGSVCGLMQPRLIIFFVCFGFTGDLPSRFLWR